LNRETQFEEHRSRMFALAYRMLGVRADAEEPLRNRRG
jgi:hypothetical protein